MKYMHINEQVEPTLLISKIEVTPKATSKKTKAYLTPPEKKMFRLNYGEQAFILYDLLLDMVSYRNPDLTNVGLVKETGWTISKLRKTKKILVDADLILEMSLSSAKGTKMKILYVGKDLVQLALCSEHARSYARQVELLAKKEKITEGEAHKQLTMKSLKEDNEDSELLDMFIESNFKGKNLEEVYQAYIAHPENRQGNCFNPFNDEVGKI